MGNSEETCSANVAIIGMAGILPGADSVQKYWNNILSKIDAITEVPRERWDWRLYYDENRHAEDKIYSKWGGFLEDLAFDPTSYGIPPKSLESVDPVQLMALEIAFRTLVDSGYNEKHFDREKASVIIGASGGAGDVGTQYGLRSELPRFQGELPSPIAERLPGWTEDTFAGILLNVVAGRIANRLNFGGVNYTTDAACASSLTAIYQAVNELNSKRSDLVIAGGVDTVQNPFGYLCFSKTQALSPRGRCNTFDSSADGIVISEGIAMVMLKRLEDAERDGDRIYAVIKGIAGGSDGKAKGLAAPLPEGQLRAMHRAYEQAGFGPESVELFEAHGTGTVAGDTAELESTTSLLKTAGASTYQSAIGSVKTMIGHTKATAGVAGLIKAALALHHNVLPPHNGVKRPNQVLQDPDCPLYIINEPMPWLKRLDQPRRAACSAFGFGGTNFHAVLEEYSGKSRTQTCSAKAEQWPVELLLFGSKSKKGLVNTLSSLQNQLKKIDRIELRDLAYSLAKEWQHGYETIAIVAKDIEDLIKKISTSLDYLQGKNEKLPVGIYYGNSVQPIGKLAVLFPGQGSQYPKMSREVALHFPSFAQNLSDADSILNKRIQTRFGSEVNLSHFIFPRGNYNDEEMSEAAKALTSTDIAQPALGAVEAGYWKLINSFGVIPELLGGHSYGEFTALFASGCYDFPTLMKLSEARGRFIVDSVKEAGGKLGAMAFVKAKRTAVEEFVKGIKDVTVANHNAPQQSIISGSKKSISEVLQRVIEKGIEAGFIPAGAAFHSPFVESAQTKLANEIKKASWSKGNIPIYSNTTGDVHSDNIGKVRNTMASHLVKPVEFVSQIEAMYRDGARIFLELGPKSVLTRLVERILSDHDSFKAVSIDSAKGGLSGLLNAFAQLLCAGVQLDVEKLFKGRKCLQSSLEDIAQLQRTKPVPKHFWFINGSGVRRANEKVKQVGVLIEDEKADLKSNETASTVKSPIFQRQEPPFHQQKHQNHRRNNKRMSTKQPPGSGNSALNEYFDMMHHFLETQERVMSMALGAKAPSRNTAFQKRQASQAQTFIKQEQNVSQEPELNGEINTQKVKDEPMSSLNRTHDLSGVNGENTLSHLEDNTVAEEKSAAAKAENSPEESKGREEMASSLLSIVEDTTGYPQDMIGLDQSLEADLGIDSIKRVEIVGKFIKMLPESYTGELGEDHRNNLNKQSTLNGILDIFVGLKSEEVAHSPFSEAEVEVKLQQTDLSLRHIIVPEPEAIKESAIRFLNKGHYIITSDKLGVSRELADLLSTTRCTFSTIQEHILKDEKALKSWCEQLKEQHESLAGIVHLTPVGSKEVPLNASVQEWRQQLQVNEKSLFILLHELLPVCDENAHIMAASSLGGKFGRRPDNDKYSGLFIQGGAVGMLKSLAEELPELRIRIVDLDATKGKEELATTLMEELKLMGGRHEVGYPEGIRTIFRTVTAPIEWKSENEEAINGHVVLATGGLKGVTAEALRELAVTGNTIIVTGRSKFPEDDEPEALKQLLTKKELREYFIKEAHNQNVKSTLADIKRKIKSVLAAREMRNNLEDFQQRGATVKYYSVDVTSDSGLQSLIVDVQKKYGPISGVVHGAGIIEDKRLSAKTAESWSRVVETKTLGLLLLQKYLEPADLKFFIVFSSVAGRYGNSGQSDYATANELMNRICCQLDDIWQNKVNVKALCWGPWGATRFGAGMVTAETEAKFAEKGVFLVSAEAGRQLFKNELIQQSDGGVEIICGHGPWEEREADLALSRLKIGPMPITSEKPLLNDASMSILDGHTQVIAANLDKNHSYLQDHKIDGVPILPAAVALEIMAEAVAFLWPTWQVSEVLDCRLLKGIEVKENGYPINIVVEPIDSNSEEVIELSVRIESTHDQTLPRLHYRSSIRLQKQALSSFTHTPGAYTEKKLTVQKAYSEWLFHGPRFQVIEKIFGLSDSGAKAIVRTSSPDLWLNSPGGSDNKWATDPALVDAAAQMIILWTRAFLNETALPARFDRVIRFNKTMPEKVVMDLQRLETKQPHVIRANVYFADEENNILLMIEGMECVSSAELNRLGRTSKLTKNISNV